MLFTVTAQVVHGIGLTVRYAAAGLSEWWPSSLLLVLLVLLLGFLLWLLLPQLLNISRGWTLNEAINVKRYSYIAPRVRGSPWGRSRFSAGTCAGNWWRFIFMTEPWAWRESDIPDGLQARRRRGRCLRLVADLVHRFCVRDLKTPSVEAHGPSAGVHTGYAAATAAYEAAYGIRRQGAVAGAASAAAAVTG